MLSVCNTLSKEPLVTELLTKDLAPSAGNADADAQWKHWFAEKGLLSASDFAYHQYKYDRDRYRWMFQFSVDLDHELAISDHENVHAELRRLAVTKSATVTHSFTQQSNMIPTILRRRARMKTIQIPLPTVRATNESQPRRSSARFVFEAMDTRVEAHFQHIFEQLAEFKASSMAIQSLQTPLHLIVFVHGLDGSAYDFRLFRNLITMAPEPVHTHLPRLVFLLSSANAKNSYLDIQTMGQRLATEIDQSIKQHGIQRVHRISFISHSLGGLIVRAALTCPELLPFQDKMHFFVSLSTPHLGMQYSDNTILDQIMTVARKWKKSEAIAQLQLLDAPKLRDCYLYKLAQRKELAWFKRLLLISSPMDKYVPFGSACVHMDVRAPEDREHGSVYVEMMNHVLMALDEGRIERWSVGFEEQLSQGLDPLGREAHIALLQDPQFIELFYVLNGWLLFPVDSE